MKLLLPILSPSALALMASSPALLASAKQNVGSPKYHKHPLLLNELPSTGEEWTSLRHSNGVQFQPSSNLSPLAQEHARRLTASFSSDAAALQTIFKSGAESKFEEYSQAWRALGFYIDCDADAQVEEEQDRDLQEGDVDHCQRYMLWAAYVDEGYSGHGVGEYQYYDRKSGKWSDYACKQESNTERCVKMDCHLPETNFSLIGFFKEPSYEEWMEQLFKHLGDCVWTDEEYQFMQNDREAWPQECTATESTDSNGNRLYYDLKPGASGSYNIGLYTDTACVVDYTEGLVEVPDVLDNGQSSTTLQETLNTWNAAFDVFKQCQPCKAYSLTAVVAGMGYEANANGDRYAGNNGRRKLEDQESEFVCDDAAGYSNVNQCMKFKTKTQMLTASWQDVVMASNQGTIAQLSIPGRTATTLVTNNSNQSTSGGSASAALGWVYAGLAVSALLFTIMFLRFMVIYHNAKDNMNDPLIANNDGVTA